MFYLEKENNLCFLKVRPELKMRVSVKQVYTSVGCNRIPEIVDWNDEGIICFGASNAVVIYDTNVKGKDPLTVYSHHRSTVNSVKWVRKPDGTCTDLVSCSADKTSTIWTLKDGAYQATNDLGGHTEPITSVYGIYTTHDKLVVYTASIDSTINVWERTNGVITLKQNLNLHGGLCLTLRAHIMPTSGRPVLFCALDDHKIHVFGEDGAGEYHRVHTLVGHDDWVRGLDVLHIDDTTILLASCSQDTYIRIWRISLRVPQQLPGLHVEQRVFIAHDIEWAVTLDAVLAAHEGWVYGVQWQPQARNEETTKKPVYRLLSSSLDKTLIVWEPEAVESSGEGQGAWVETVRVGEVGGHGLGFYGSRFGPGGDAFMGHGYNGSLHVWTLDKETNQWSPSVVIGGHFNAVEDVRWEPQGRFIISVAADQTTRLHAPWKRKDGQGLEWHELARPQVHGYDMASVAVISPTVFASAAEEKVIRVFSAPQNFVQNFANITGYTIQGATGDAEGATVPSLGLSNKAVMSDDDSARDDNDGYFVPLHMAEPPTEDTLMQNTLWPETQKLYGHGYEVFTLAASPDGTLLASACKSTTAEHANVILWCTKTWRQVQKLHSHALTVTQIAFSPNSNHILTVSRDRRWTLYERTDDLSFTQIAASDKSNGVHSRIIWCCAFANDDTFATGSRDGKVCVWSKTEPTSDPILNATSLGEYSLLGKPLDIPSVSVTALAFAPYDINNVSIVAVGSDTGVVSLYSFDGCAWEALKEIDRSAAHHLAVKRLCFKPADASDDDLLLASCGADHFVRIHCIAIKN